LVQSLTITVEQLAPAPQPDPNAGYQFKYTTFGEVLLGADVDGDGYADLVVGAPTADGAISAAQARGRPLCCSLSSRLVDRKGPPPSYRHKHAQRERERERNKEREARIERVA
jgi:hypothetical protein